ncbi:MAG: hypothetical protein ACJAT7_000614 [Psychromonas sp.]|jgi:hypothetical protein
MPTTAVTNMNCFHYLMIVVKQKLSLKISSGAITPHPVAHIDPIGTLMLLVIDAHL